ncbi:MAG: cation-transporting P-type ATPase [Balneolaceae bacterium]
MNQQEHTNNQEHTIPYHSRTAEEVLKNLDSNVEKGLNRDQYNRSRKNNGPNRLREFKQRNLLQILLDQFKSIVIIILVVAAIVAFAFQHYPDGIAITAVLVVNALIGFFTEWKASRSMEALRRTERDKVRVRRNGKEQEVESDTLVPGDILILESSDLVPADVRLIESNNLNVNESALTGESVSVLKSTSPVDDDAAIADRHCMVFRGTFITDGSAEGVVTATGMNTEIGQISELAETAEKEATLLQKKLNNLGRKLAWLTITVAAVVAVTGLLAGREPQIMIETAIALGVAAIPEGLPIVATIALARGMYVLSKKNVLINRLQAVETLGSTGVIFTDKTGTLTENHMTVRRVSTPEGDFRLDEHSKSPEAEDGTDPSVLRRIMEVVVLCSNASVTDEDDDLKAEDEQGDPTETALLRAGLSMELQRGRLLSEKPEVREVPFSSDTMMMATYNQAGSRLEVNVKGAPEKLLDACTGIVRNGPDAVESLSDEEKDKWLERSGRLAGEGLRLLAVADKTVEDKDAEPFEELRFLGLIGLLDPARSDVGDAIRECQSAGIRVIMVTGDQGATATAIAKETGITNEEDPVVIHSTELKDPDELSDSERRKILESNIFSRVSPQQKLHLVKMMQGEGWTVAMTGDGVNDTPALKKADIGIAMGRRGTDAAREISDMVLLDDAFSSIVTAVRHGRIIFGNIRKSVLFMLCTNVAEVVAVMIATVIGGFYFFPLPLLPLQILYLNVITDVFPALALGMGTGEEGIMKQKPRPQNEPVLAKSHWYAIGGWSVILSASVLGALALAVYQMGFEQERAVTISFLTLAFGKLWFVYNLRNPKSHFLSNDIIRNPYIAGSIILCIILLLATVYLPVLAGVLRTENPGGTGWLLIFLMSLIPFVWGQLLRIYQSLQKT